MKILLMEIVKNLVTTKLHRIKLGLQKTGKVLNMKSILATVLELFKAHCLKDIKMSIEYHLQKPSIGVFLWTIVTQAFGAIEKKSEVFNITRNEFYRDYALPIGLCLGYDGVDHSIHYDRDFFAPYTQPTFVDDKTYPSIKGHLRSPLEDIKKSYTTLALMEKELLIATKIVPKLYKELLLKKK